MKPLADILPTRLREAAYWAGEEAAWPRPLALEVAGVLATKGVAVLGAEVWLPTQEGPTIPMPFFYEYDVGPRRQGESWETFVSRSASETQRYVATFEWDPNDLAHRAAIPYFNLTTCAQDELPG